MNQNFDTLVSIITVVFNGEKYLEQTIQSVVNQTYKNIEYIIIDGGSTDRTLEIIKKHENKIAYWYSEPDNGLYDAMNKGIKKSNGNLIGMLNSDDWYETNIVELMVSAYKNKPHKRIFHADRFDILKDNEKKLYKFNPSVRKFIYLGMTFNHPSIFVAKEEYELHNYNTRLKSYSDYQFILEIYLRDKNVFHYIEKPLVNYRLDGISGQIKFNQRLKEGFLARKNAGLNLTKNLISVFLRCIKPFVYHVYIAFKRSNSTDVSVNL